MTGIIVDRYKNHLYVFADGRNESTDWGYIFTDCDRKIRKLDETTILTNCGDSHIIDHVEELLLDGRLTAKDLKEVEGDGQVILVSDQKITIIDCAEFESPNLDKFKQYKTTMSTFSHSVCPLFFGSGTECLSGAYLAFNPKSVRTDREYISRIEKIFQVACKKISSMGQLYQVESIKLKRNKSEKT